MPPLGDYSLHIAPAAAIATANKTMMQNTPRFAGHFDGRGGAPVLYRTHRPQCREFTISQVPEMARSSWIAKKFIKGMTYQWKAKDMVNAWEDLYGAADIVI